MPPHEFVLAVPVHWVEALGKALRSFSFSTIYFPRRFLTTIGFRNTPVYVYSNLFFMGTYFGRWCVLLSSELSAKRIFAVSWISNLTWPPVGRFLCCVKEVPLWHFFASFLNLKVYSIIPGDRSTLHSGQCCDIWLTEMVRSLMNSYGRSFEVTKGEMEKVYRQTWHIYWEWSGK